MATLTGYSAYVDGAFLDGRGGYGAVILKDAAEIHRLFGNIQHDLQSRQVTGELVATMSVLDWCQTNQVSAITIFYDYTGIEMWATAQWKANLPLTQRYQRYIRACPVKIQWRKVKSHSANQWNDLADELAKRGALASP